MTSPTPVQSGVPAPVTPPLQPPSMVPATSFAASLAAQLRAGSTPAVGTAGSPPARPVTLGEMVALQPARLTLPNTVSPPAVGAGAPALQAAAAPPAGDAGRVLAAANRYLGVPYRWGGTDPASGLDCSGFVQRVFADLGIGTPRVSKDQSRAGVAVPSLAEARPGDLVYWNGRGGRSNHIGIYAGDGQMIHAPRTGDVVRYAPVRKAPPDAIRRLG